MIIGVVGFSLFLITALLSQFTPHDFDAGFGGDDTPSFDHDTGTISQTDVQEAGPSPLSLRTISIFFALFGATGWMSMHFGASPLLATICGLLMGLLFAWIVFKIVKSIYKQQGNSLIQTKDYIGLTGRVITTITPMGIPGEISVSLNDQRITFMAQCTSQTDPIFTGSQVKIIDISGDFAIVVPATNQENKENKENKE